MGKKPFFSIVMPVYNVETYLEKAINSIINQTFDDFELILVDDASPDQSGRLCDFFAEKDKRIKVIHLPDNGGLSNARNQGMRCVCGEYVWFVDSDDYVEQDLLMNVFESLQRHPAELVVYGLQEDYYDSTGTLKYTKEVRMEEKILDEQHEVRENIIHLEDATLYGYAWNKFYSVSKIRERKLKFKKITLIEDIDFNVRYCMDIASMNVLSIAPYHYNKRMENSLTSKYIKDYFKLNRYRVKMIFDQYQTWGMCTTQVKQILAKIYIRYIMSVMERHCHKKSEMDFRKFAKWMSCLYKDPMFCELSEYYKSDNKLMMIVGKIIIGRHKILSWCMGWSMYFVKSKIPMVFARIKQNK